MLFLISVLAALAAAPARAQDVSITTSSLTPTYVALRPNINDFTRFADGGPDGNWYIGFNNAWIVKLPPAPEGDWARAYIGARIGRAKTRPNPDKPWLRELITGRVYMAISPIPAWTSQQSYFLAETSDISLEPDPSTELSGLGPAYWFWAEVPLSRVSNVGPNYLIVWSPTEYFTQASSSPILAAAAGPDSAAAEPLAWNNHSILGVPPRVETYSLETPLNNIYPALAIKLVPTVTVDLSAIDFAVQHSGQDLLVSFAGVGQDVGEAWVESSRDQLDWSRLTRIIRRPPFTFTLKGDLIPAPGTYLRGVVRDGLGDTAASAPFMLPYAQQ